MTDRMKKHELRKCEEDGVFSLARVRCEPTMEWCGHGTVLVGDQGPDLRRRWPSGSCRAAESVPCWLSQGTACRDRGRWEFVEWNGVTRRVRIHTRVAEGPRGMQRDGQARGANSQLKCICSFALCYSMLTTFVSVKLCNL